MSTVDDLVTWRGLPRDVRAAIAKGARSGLILQTPELRRATYAWANTNPWQRPSQWALAIAVCVLTTIAVVLPQVDRRGALALWLPLAATVYLAAAAIAIGFARPRVLRPHAMASNAMGMLFDAPEVAPTPLVVSQRRRRAEWIYPAMMVWAYAAYEWTILWPFEYVSPAFWAGAVGFLAAGLTVIHFLTGRHWQAGVRGEPLLCMDTNGIGAPRLGVLIPWQDIAYVRTRIYRVGGDQRPAIEFRAKNPEAVLASAQPPRSGARLKLRRMLRREGGLVVPVSWLDQPLLDVLITARNYLAAEQRARV